MAVNKVNIMVIILVFAIAFLSIVRTKDTNLGLQRCLTSMEIYCDVEKINPSAIECARTALYYWRYKIFPPENDMEKYHMALFLKLIITEKIQTPLDFCHNKGRLRKGECIDGLENFMPEEYSSIVQRAYRDRGNGKEQEYVRKYRKTKEEQRNYAVRHAFLYAVQLHGAEIETFEYEYEYMSYILDQLELMNDVDSPKEFCHIKHQPGYVKPTVL